MKTVFTRVEVLALIEDIRMELRYRFSYEFCGDLGEDMDEFFDEYKLEDFEKRLGGGK